MNILIVDNSVIPVNLYGGTERVIWFLGQELVRLGHRVSYLVKKGSRCEFAKIYTIDDSQPIIAQIPKDIEVVHFNFDPGDLHRMEKPYILTMHGNLNTQTPLDKNTVFVSKNHAERYGSDSFVHNGLDWNAYGFPDLKATRKRFHFLARAAWGVKNLKGAMQIMHLMEGEKLNVLGGKRWSERVLKMGPAYLFSPQVSFRGMIGGAEKNTYLNQSKGLLFPVLWHEPFGLALIESLYFGCPVFGTPYGSLPEIVNEEVGFLSNKKKELAHAMQHAQDYSADQCHVYAKERFSSKEMALNYLKKYAQVIAGNTLNLKNPALIEKPQTRYLAFD